MNTLQEKEIGKLRELFGHKVDVFENDKIQAVSVYFPNLDKRFGVRINNQGKALYGPIPLDLERAFSIWKKHQR